MSAPVAEEDNRHAGQGAVLLDIGGSIGALVVTLPAELVGVEIEIRPVQVGSAGAGDADVQPRATHHDAHDRADDHAHHDAQDHSHDDAQDHSHDDAHDHSHQHHSAGTGPPWPHVAVVARPAGAQVIHSAVFGELSEGTYELYVRPSGPVMLTVDVVGGQVSEADWPA